MTPSIIETDRLILRRWQSGDLDPFATMNADPRVMEFFPALLSRDETATMIDRMEKHFSECGYGLWATELKSTGDLIGFIGLSIPAHPLPFSPCVEIGWRLAHVHWGQGYAQEGARAALRAAFVQFDLGEVVSFTAAINTRSRRVMERIGMARNPEDDFDHPRVAEGHPLRPHVLYRVGPASIAHERLE